MGRTASLAILLVVLTSGACCAPELTRVRVPDTGGDRGMPLTRIAFGSCARQHQPQPIWEAVLEAGPELFLFLGDNIYADTQDMDVMRSKYSLLAAQPGYQKLRQRCPVLATWDDHDYGADDAGHEYPKKEEAKQIFLDFFGEPPGSARRAREGIYDATVHGPEGKRVQIILLDTRTFRSPLVKGARIEDARGRPGPYVGTINASATMLGAAQWEWLAEQLHVPAEVRILCSSVQVVATEHGYETWGNFPRERTRLLALIAASSGATVILSGDRHHAEISRDDSPGFPLVDVTSSSLNAPRAWINEHNARRVGCVYFDVNFGLLLLDWERRDPVLTVEIRGEKGAVAIRESWFLRELSARP